MADEIFDIGGVGGSKKRFKDLGDGSHGEVMGVEGFKPVGSHNSGLAIATAQALAAPAGAQKLLIQAIDQNVRFTMDGVDPTASSGFRITAGDPPIEIPVGQDAGTAIRVIEEAASASLQFQWGS